MRLVAPTAFKGTMTPLEAAALLASPGDRLLPLSDGGDGFQACLHHVLGGTWVHVAAKDPFGRPISAPVLYLPDGPVVLECAKVIGMAGLDRLDPITASSLGFGELIQQVQEAKVLWIGLGGSATVDGGQDWPALQVPQARVFCDVTTELGDAARCFGPQKGAKPEDIPLLTARLLTQGLPRGPRTGAAGGLGARLLACGATLVDGAEAMLDTVGFDAAAAGCSEVVTGEGCLDASTMEGKLPAVVARRARALGMRVLGRFGSRGEGWAKAAELFDEVSFFS